MQRRVDIQTIHILVLALFYVCVYIHLSSYNLYTMICLLCFVLLRFELAMKLKDLRTAYQLAQQIDVRISISTIYESIFIFERFKF